MLITLGVIIIIYDDIWLQFYFIFVVIVGYIIGCNFAFGFVFFLVGNLKTLQHLIDLFRFPKLNSFEEKLLHPIYLLAFSIPHKSYRFLEKNILFLS